MILQTAPLWEVFDGNNHSITNKITASDVNADANIALFPYVKGSSTVIKNLTVKGTPTRGSIVGYLDGNASVENCISETVITTSSEDIGGIVCKLKKGYVSNCKNKGAITSTSNTEGGILGYTNGGSGAIDRCINYGNISGRYLVKTKEEVPLTSVSSVPSVRKLFS